MNNDINSAAHIKKGMIVVQRQYDGSMEGSEYTSLFHMSSVISRLAEIRERLYKNLNEAEIAELYFKVTFPLRNVNPLIVKDPICVCLQDMCTCVIKLPQNKLDTSHSVTMIIYGDCKSCDTYVKRFNVIRQDNIDKYHNILKLKNKKDTAFQLLSISYDEMFYKCPEEIPNNIKEYAIYVERVFRNIMKVFHRDIGYRAYQWICSMFKTYNFYNGVSLQIEPYFCPTWDMFGTFDESHENNIDIMRFLNNKDYRYYSGYANRLKQYKLDTGFIREAKNIFCENNRVLKNRKIILQIMSPDGLWIQKSKGRYFRYSDIQIGFSAKGKMQLEELILHSILRELYEEIDMSLSKKDAENIEYVSQWGNIYLFKLDISGMRKLPINPF